ncbi:Mg2+ transporter protein CorA-like/Zinc transport protein ZntB [Penicillium argentinense]|uniref:Mg2+ transporter protein CorA-like/Zinc transport protein ZntB n=1 Tax=Penicillium argentinense TaxID=1131581 RepID=A0A9W9EWS2_9EURO|nr:Mg2+ transporter protein CorA-like/Zinc transport protein ZntB [Penicillium argentinense]KAJ5089412.1 Mg2+ transporter protein CorA-like/Zinc transport protein ZntB [Penicillium argentinense]
MPGDQSENRLLDWLQQQPDDPLRPDTPVENADTTSATEVQRVGLRGTSDAAGPRSSLDDVLHHDPGARGDLPETIGLPDSLASSSPTVNRESINWNRSDNSLEDILQVGAPAIPSAPSTNSRQAERLPLGRPLRRVKRRTTRYTYDKILENAGEVLDYIKHGNVCKRSRHDGTSIIYYDYSEGIRSDPKVINEAYQISALGYPPQEVSQRLLIVEDLSKPTIDALGETFSINPEFFEEHLLNSGYAGPDYDMLPARTWPTAHLKKSYCSMRWIRPVYRQPMYSSNRTMRDLVKASTKSSNTATQKDQNSDLSYWSDEEKENENSADGVEHFTRYGVVTTRVSTNIFRSDWALWTDPAKTANMKRECGLEERLSIWKGTLLGRNCDIVIILSDPLPQVDEEHPAPETIDYDSGISETDIDSAEKGIAHLIHETTPRFMGDATISKPWDYMIKSRKRKRVVPASTNSEKNIPLFSHKVIIKQIAPRQELAVDLDHVFRTSESTKEFGQGLGYPRSTSEGIREEIEQQTGQASLTRPLIRIIKQDSLALLKQLGHVFDEIETGILDDIKMEDRLSSWRQVIGRAQRELPELQAYLEPFLAFVASLHPTRIGESGSSIESDVTKDIQELMNEIAHVSSRLQRTSALLTSNMGLLDSRRSIDEALAVTRLTELAFLFVPLSFAATIFGMQVDPLADNVPIRSFFIVAIVVTAFAYLMRMTMRSRWIAYFKMFMRNQLQRYAESHGHSIPTRSIPILLSLQYMGNRLRVGVKRGRRWILRTARTLWRVFGFVILFIGGNGAVLAAPLALLWTRDLDFHIQIAATVSVLMLVLMTVGLSIWRMSRSDPAFRSALPRLAISIYRRFPTWAQGALIFLSLSALCLVIPVSLIWTSPLAMGIKCGLMVLAFLPVGFAVAFKFFWWFMNYT